ncbi:hypothetical protein [Arenicella xantha]|uniref:Uncharacterized protein n=1 Tax=Arenicella xantha TaxID=644221 RepID=A0A395JJ69_9GAMM|nr:hypothetical protein [Arenicella xantha]RBP48818.1 hypothetical protein DFR28_105157 [Arenicella xantha]
MKKLIIAAILLMTPAAHAANFYDLAIHKGETVADIPLEEYSNIWWQWTQTMPKEVSPISDATGENCHQGQNGDVWFLAGGYGSSKVTRTCTIPEGKHIFFPVINMLYYPKEKHSPSCASVKKGAALNNEELLSIRVELDQIKAINPAHYRLSSPGCFDLFGLLPEDVGAPEIFPSASDGYWVMLKPLSKGKHSLKFSAQYGREKGAYSKMLQDIHYEIIVE